MTSAVVFAYHNVGVRCLRVLLAHGVDPNAVDKTGKGYTAAYVIEPTTKRVLFEENANMPLPTASMAKMMTTHVAFDLIGRGDLSPARICTVRPETWQRWHEVASPDWVGQR